MKKFSFSLQKVLNLREFAEKEAKEELGRVISISNKLQSELEEVAKARVTTRNSSGNVFNANEFLAVENYVNRLDIRKEALLTELAQNEILIEEKRKIFAEAMINRKVITKLKEKKYKEWRQSMLKEEEAFIDDVSNAKFVSKT